MRVVQAQVVLIAVALLAPAAQAKPSITLSPEGFGPLRIGMTRIQAEKALGAKLVEPAPEADQGTCLILQTKILPGFNIMLENDRIVRLSLWLNQKPAGRGAAIKVHTFEGVGLLSTDQQVRAAYPKGLVRTAADYDEEPAHNLVFHERANPKFGLRFEIDQKGRVNVLHAGREPALGYIEDCL